jgi:hypothetical protein
MKIDELLKRLENVRTDEDEINEKCEIAEYLARKIGVNKSPYAYYIMTKDKKIYDLDSYEKLLKSNKVSPNNTYVYVENTYFTTYDPGIYLYSFLILESKITLIYAYLSRLSLSSLYAVPAPGLKYVAKAIRFLSRTVVEVVDIGTAVINTNLLTLIHGIISNKYIDAEEVEDIALQLDSQKLFAGYDSNEAWRILDRYYEKHDTSLAKDVEAIKDAYNHIFNPCRIIYDLETEQIQVGDKTNDKPRQRGGGQNNENR